MKVGKILLLITGILYIISAVVTAITGVISFIGALGENIGSAIVSLVVVALSFCFSFFAGHAGVMTWKTGTRKYVKRAFIFAVVILVLGILNIIFNGLGGGILSLVVTVCYIIGAFMVQKKA